MVSETRLRLAYKILSVGQCFARLQKYKAFRVTDCRGELCSSLDLHNFTKCTVGGGVPYVPQGFRMTAGFAIVQ